MNASTDSTDPPTAGGARVTLRRTHPDDVGQRQVLARIDDGPTVTLLFGGAQTFDVAPGEHRLRANNTLFAKTRVFTLRPGDHIEFMLINTGGTLTVGLLATFGVAPLFLKIEQRMIASTAPDRSASG